MGKRTCGLYRNNCETEAHVVEYVGYCRNRSGIMSFFKKNFAVALTVFAVLANAVLPGAAYAGTSRDSRTS